MTPTAPHLETAVHHALRDVIDPELGVNLVDLGLIYSVEIQPRRVRVLMTLTTPGCPMHDSLAHGVRLALLQLDDIDEAEVEIVWDPPWNPSMMSDNARAQLGMS